MRIAVTLVLVLIGMTLTGCATQRLKGSVARIHSLDEAPRSFVVLPLEAQRESPDFPVFASVLTRELTSRGWREVAAEQADIAIILEYLLDTSGRSRGGPVFELPSDSNMSAGSPQFSGQSFSMSDSQTTFVGADPASAPDPLYLRKVSLRMFSLDAWRGSKRRQAVFEAEITSTGFTGRLPVVMPTMIRAIFKDFPGKSGARDEVDLPISRATAAP